MIRRIALITALATLLVAPTASAGKPVNGPLPKPDDPTIKVPTSLAGISVGQASSEAEAAWGSSKGCSDQQGNLGRQCNYGNPHRTGFANQLSYDGAIVAVGIGTAGEQFKGPLMKIRTDEGLGLGSKFKQVAKAYPDAKVKGRAVIITDAESRMVFFAGDKPRGRITQVTLIDAHPPGA